MKKTLFISFKKLVEKIGIENIRLYVPMRPIHPIPGLRFGLTDSSDTEILVECSICEDRYKVADGHKVSLKALNKNFGTEHFYQRDLDQMILSGTVRVKECAKTIEATSI